jgi:hypothetical protein
LPVTIPPIEITPYSIPLTSAPRKSHSNEPDLNKTRKINGNGDGEIIVYNKGRGFCKQNQKNKWTRICYHGE